jgi:hypothetical protein
MDEWRAPWQSSFFCQVTGNSDLAARCTNRKSGCIDLQSARGDVARHRPRSTSPRTWRTESYEAAVAAVYNLSEGSKPTTQYVGTARQVVRNAWRWQGTGGRDY